MSLGVTLYAAFLFFILTPNILLRIPSNGSKFVVAGVHALVFGLVFFLTNKIVLNATIGMEGLQAGQLKGSNIRDQNRRYLELPKIKAWELPKMKVGPNGRASRDAMRL